MKKLTFLALVAMLANTALRSQNLTDSFILKGKIIGEQTGKLYLYYTDKNNGRRKDSTMIKNGAFVFAGSIAEPTSAYLEGNVSSMSVDEPNSTSLFLEPGVMTISLKLNDFKHAVITGSATQRDADELQKNQEPVVKAMQPLNEAYNKINEAYISAMKLKKPQAVIDSLQEKAEAKRDEFWPFSEKLKVISFAFIAGHPNSYVTAYTLRGYSGQLQLDTLQFYYGNMSAKVQQSVFGKQIAKDIQKRMNGSPGSQAKDFTAKDINGNVLNLASFKGKYVLVDFWASWCIPCRHSNPHLKELYAKYHDKGFEIIGVSDDDRNDTAWRKAVAQDGINIWRHVLRGLDMVKLSKGEDNDNDISEKFGVSTLPTKILIDKDGKIIGRYDQATDEETAEMDKKLAALLQ